MENSERNKIGTRTSVAGLCANIFLFAAKFAAGTLSSSIAVIADGFNNLSDALSSVVSLIGFKVSAKKPDREHPYGHGRIEYISALVVAFFIFLTAFTFFKNSIMNCIHPEKLNTGLPVYTAIAVSIAVKIALGLFTKAQGRRIESVTLEASGTDALNDVLVTLSTAVSIVVFAIWKVNIDGYIGILVSLLIFKSGVEVLKDSISPLLGMSPDPEIVRKIEEDILSAPHVLGMHDLIVHNYGPSRMYASAHAEVPAECSVLEVHEEIDRVEQQVRENLGVELTIHFDPVEDSSPDELRLRERIKLLVASIDPAVKFHDFHLVPGEKKTAVHFDIVYPFDCRMKEEELVGKIKTGVAAMGSYTPVINVDYPFA